MRKLLLPLLLIAFFQLTVHLAIAQNSIGIGTNTPRSSAILDVTSQNQGLLFPRVDTTNITGLGLLDHGLVVYDTVVGEVFVWDGTTWQNATQSPVTPTLQSAYDGGQTVNMGTGNIDFISSSANSVLYIDEANENVGIGTTNPSQKLDVVGNMRFSGALMPNNAAGTAGQVLTSAGAGAPPVWAAGGSGWGLTGNAGTVDGTNFIGTTDFVALNFRVGGLPSGRIDPVGIQANTFFGYSSGSSNTGTLSTGLGYQTLQNNTGSNNTAVGSYSMINNTSGFANTAMGGGAMRFNTTGAVNSGYGVNTLYQNTTGNNNTAIGGNAMFQNTTGSENTAIGTQAMQLGSSGNSNTATGFYALLQNNADNNVAMGTRALESNTTGTGNTAIGYFSGYTTTFANANTTGSNNTFLGYNSGPNSTTQLTNATAIGANAKVNADNAFVLGGTGANAVNVGIGTTTPVSPLHISSAAVSTTLLVTNDAIGTSNTDGLLIGENNSGTALILNYENERMIIGTNSNLNQIMLQPTGSIGLRNIAPFTDIHLGEIPAGGEFTGTNEIPLAAGSRVLITSQNNNGGTVNAAAESVLMLHRAGVNGQSFSQLAGFSLSRYSNATNASFTQLDINLLEGINSGNFPAIMSLRSNGNVGIGTIAPTSALDVVGDINLTGEVNRTSTGTTNLLPIAMGSIAPDGTVVAQSGNITCVYGGSGTYRITITGVTLTPAVIVSINTNSGIRSIANYEIIGGDLIIFTHDGGGGGGNQFQDHAFSFLVFQI